MMTRTAIHPLKILAALGAAFLVWGLVLAYASSPAWAADITVTTADDELNSDGDCSLREAIEAANTDTTVDGCDAGSGEDTINLPSGTYLLSSQLPTITSTVTVDGGSPNPTIDGGNAVRPFFVASGAQLSLNKLTLTKGNHISNDGGAIRNQGTLVVSNSTISASAAVSAGAIFNQGTLEVSDSTFSQNSARGDGGAIRNEGTLEVNNSTFSQNIATGNAGGAIANRSSGTATVSNSTLSGNSASRGGAMSNQGTLEVNNSTFSDNRATNGGGVWNSSSQTLTVTNSTFSGNSADAGGGIFNEFDTLTLKNTIVANSPSGGDCFARPSDPITDAGYNLVEDGSCITDATSFSGDPLLGDLADNGGPTQTMALQDGSPAIDAIPDGTNGCGTDITQDQRGVSRPQGSACDIGAFEVEVEVDNTAPFVTETSPPVLQKTDNVTAEFSEKVQNVSTETFILERRIAVKKSPPKFVLVDATVTPSNDGLSAVLDPVQDLPKGDYRATITTEVTDLAEPANALDQDSGQEGNQPKVWTFRVAK
jgi:CSLREA domain-containing protein